MEKRLLAMVGLYFVMWAGSKQNWLRSSGRLFLAGVPRPAGTREIETCPLAVSGATPPPGPARDLRALTARSRYEIDRRARVHFFAFCSLQHSCSSATTTNRSACT